MSRLQGSQSTQRTLVNAYLVHVFLCKFMVASGPLLTLSDSNKTKRVTDFMGEGTQRR